MTPYEQGFMSKCAEYGLDAGTAMGLLGMARQSGLVKSSANLLPMVLPRMGETFSSKTLGRTFGKAKPVIGPRSNWLGKMWARAGEFIGGGNKNARAFTDTIGRLQDKLARFQAEGRIDAAKAIQHQIDSLRSTATHQGFFSRWLNGDAVGDQRMWRKYFGDVGSRDVADELNKVKWARRAAVGVPAAAVGVPTLMGLQGGGGYDEYDYGWYDQYGPQYPQYQQYGNVSMYR